MNTNEPALAACLTPPTVGGIAVIQIVTQHGQWLRPLFKASRPIEFDLPASNELRLCRLMDGEQVIDDAVVAARRNLTGQLVVDVSLHGGPRIVQRALLLLKSAGARIVPALELLDSTWAEGDLLHRETLEAIAQAKTRSVAVWLATTMDRLPREVEQLIGITQTDRLDSVRARLHDWLEASRRVRRVLTGVRVVLVGRPNSGKSTLANQLAGRHSAIVSDTPGTTRDWLEHPGAIDGVPFTFVDTAGLRESTDAIEVEAIRRTHRQVATADIVLHVIDRSSPPASEDLPRANDANRANQEFTATKPTLVVWNKSDLPADPDRAKRMECDSTKELRVSARTGEGLDLLRSALLETAGLAGWRQLAGVPFTVRQVQAVEEALSVMETDRPDMARACRWLEIVRWGQDLKKVARVPGYNPTSNGDEVVPSVE